jgi:hypothetical protein
LVSRVAKIIEANTVKDYAQGIVFALNDLCRKGFITNLAAVELDGFMLFLVPATLHHFAALAVWATIGCGIRCWVAVLPE